MYQFIFIDDEDLIRELFPGIIDFTRLGFCLKKTFSGGEQAIEYLEHETDIDVIITDVKMGAISGIDICEYIHRTGKDIEVVIVSGYKEFEYAQKAVKYNVFDYLIKPTSYSDLEGLFVALKERLDRKYKKTPDSEPEDYHYINSIEAVKTYVDQNYAKDISLDEAAYLVSMNAAYLGRLFKREKGVSFLDYLMSIRMNHAIELLKDASIKVYEISGMVGYKSTKHFYKVFKQYTGYTPTSYRSKWDQLKPINKYHEE